MMNMDFELEYEKAIKKLDTIDFYPYFKTSQNLEQVISKVENDYGEVFDITSRSEIADYINNRYRNIINVYEVSYYTFEIK